MKWSLRETRYGSYGDSLSINCGELTVRRLLEYLQECGVDTTDTHIQTDNGTDFEGGTVREKLSGFVHTIESLVGATHTYIPPGCSNANADVEPVHATIEQHFSDIASFSSRRDFFAKIAIYPHFYNLAYKIGSGGHRSPLQILHERDPTLDPRLFMLLPCDLDRAFRTAKVGHHLPGLTARATEIKRTLRQGRLSGQM